MEGRRLVVTLSFLVFALSSTLVAVVATEHRGGGSTTRVGSGHAVSVGRMTGVFRGVELRGTAAVAVHVGPKTSVVVRGDDNIVPLLETQVANGVLTISDHGSFRTSTPLTVTVTTPDLTSASLDGTGRVDLVGTASSLALRLAGTGTLNASQLPAQTVRAELAGTGTVHVRAARSLDAQITGTGSIIYHGRPAHLRSHVSGTGSVVGA